MKVLQVMPQYPWPMIDGGKISLAKITEHLSALGHDVHVLVYAVGSVQSVSFVNVTIDIIDHAPKNTPLRILRSLFDRRALYLFKHDTSAMRQAIDHALRTEQIDVLHADHTCMGEVVRDAARAHGKPWGLRLHNIEWMIWDRYAERFPAWHPTRWYLKGQANKIKEAEAQLISEADIVFTITPVDRDRALALAPNANIVVAPAGVEPPLNVPLRSPEGSPSGLLQVPFRSPTVVMASTYRWIHNVDALRWFVDRVWPLVRQKVADAEFHVLGKDPPPFLSSYRDQGIVVRGFVDDLYAAYAESDVSVAPLFVGSGMRLKIVEAMAAGLPVVATSISAEGIELSEADGLFREDEAEGTAEAIVSLLLDRNGTRELGSRAQEAVVRTYTWRSSVSAMAGAYERLISGQE